MSSYTWDILQNGDANWNTVANWKNNLNEPAGVYPNSSTATANLITGYSGTEFTASLSTDIAVKALVIGKTTQGYADLKISTSNSSKLLFSDATCSVTCTSFTGSIATLDCPISLTCTTFNISVPTSSTLKVTGTLTGPSTTTINVSGGGTLIFEKDALFSGTITSDATSTVMLGNHTSEGLVSNKWTDFSIGYNHFAAIRHDGTLWTWGKNDYNQCGRADTSDYTKPVMVTIAGQNGGADNDWSHATCGNGYTFAVKTNGTLWSCGSNHNSVGIIGRTPDGSNPVSRFCKVGSATDWKRIYTTPVSDMFTEAFAIGLKTDNTLWSWGMSNSGSLGLGETTAQGATPAQILCATTNVAGDTPANNDWKEVFVSNQAYNDYFYYRSHVMAIKTDGTLWAWGNNSYTQLGVCSLTDPTQIDVSTTNITLPQRVGKSTDFWLSNNPSTPNTSWTFISAAVAPGTCYAVSTTGKMYSWGDNTNLMLGLPANITSQVGPAQLTTSVDWQKVVASQYTMAAMALDVNGKIWTIGNVKYISRSYSTSTVSPFTQEPDDGMIYSDVKTSRDMVLVMSSTSQLYIWGNTFNSTDFGGDGIYGLSDGFKPYFPIEISGSWKKIINTGLLTIGIDSSGTMWAWGDNGNGQLGQGNTNDYKGAPVKITGTWVDVASRGSCVYAIKYVGNSGVDYGTLWSWGANSSSSLGRTVTGGNNTTPVQVGSSSSWRNVYAGSSCGMAINTSNGLYAWGFNGSGRLGNNSTTNITTPTQIASGTQWSTVSMGDPYTLGLSTGGALYGWGNGGTYNLSGVGTGNILIPTTVTGSSKANTIWVSVAAGSTHSMAVAKNTTNNTYYIYAWGDNTNGSLGTGNNTNVTGLPANPNCGTSRTDWSNVYCGGYISAAITSAGDLYTFGKNSTYGVLGLGNTTNQNSPQKVVTKTAHVWNSVSMPLSDGTYTLIGRADTTNALFFGNNYYYTANQFVRNIRMLTPMLVSADVETTFVNNGTLVIDVTGPKSLPNKILGDGTVEYKGSSICKLSPEGIEGKTTTVTVSSGKLETSFTGNNNPTITVSSGSSIVVSTYNQIFTNQFTKNGSGTMLVPKGLGQYGQTCTLNGGTIVVGKGVLGYANITATDNNAKVAISSSSTTDTGVLNLTGGTFQSTYTSNTPELQDAFKLVNYAGSSGIPTGKYITSGTTTTEISTDTDTTLPAGSPTKIKQSGSGKLIVSGTYTSPIEMMGGNLHVTGTVSNTITVSSSAKLSGTGTVGATTVLSGGTLSPGASPGHLTINGNLVLESGSIFEWELAGNTADALDGGVLYDTVTVSGDLTINTGAIMKVLLEPGVDFENTFWNADRTWDVFSVPSGTTTGNFGTISESNVVYTGTGAPDTNFLSSFSTDLNAQDVNMIYTRYVPPAVNMSVLTTQNAKASEFVMAGALNDDTKTALKDDGYSLVNVGGSYLGGAVTVKSQATTNDQAQIIVSKGNLDITGNINMVPVDATDALTREYYTYFGTSWRQRTTPTDTSYERYDNGTWVTVHSITAPQVQP